MAENQLTGRGPVKKIGDGMDNYDVDSPDEDVPDYPAGFEGIQKAYEDIQEIFADVAREYPNFLHEDEEGIAGGDQTKITELSARPDGGDGRKKLGMQPPRKGHEKLPILPPLEKRPLSSGSTGIIQSEPTVVLPNSLKPNSNRPKSPTAEVEGPSKRFESTSNEKRISEEENKNVGTDREQMKMLLPNTAFKLHHDSFANEFIRTSGKEFNESMVTSMFDMNKGSQSPRSPPPPTYVDSHAVKAYEGNAVPSSLKLVYSPPVWPHMESLYKIISRLPTLRSLILDDSKLKCLRDLGSMLPNLNTLSVMRCGLNSLDGTLGLSNLEVLFAGANNITDPTPLAFCSNLRFADLSDNKIEDLELFEYLGVCTYLTCMKLMDNPVVKNKNFHTEMLRMIPNLRELRPRNIELHGEEVFDLYDDIEGNNDEDYQPFGWSKSTIPGMASSGMLSGDKKPGPRSANESRGWREEERRLREIYTPGDSTYKKHVMKSIPYTIDEMDALLEDLESVPKTQEHKQQEEFSSINKNYSGGDIDDIDEEPPQTAYDVSPRHNTSLTTPKSRSGRNTR